MNTTVKKSLDLLRLVLSQPAPCFQLVLFGLKKPRNPQL